MTPTPLGETLGLRFLEVSSGDVRIEMPVEPPVLNSMGYLHGGALSALADTAMGFAAFTQLEAGEASTTVEFKINFLRPVFSGVVQARSRVIRRGQHLIVVDCDIRDGQERLVAQSLGTHMILRGEHKEGRQHSASS
jgi:uncharacterized protein (TIGR00369 family)